MNGYIDMHCHILPGVDDGAETPAEMKAMLEIAYKDGIRCIIATPHHHPIHGNGDPKLLKEKASQLRQAAHEIDKNFRIYLGSEIYFRQDLPELLKNHEILTMNRRRYILIEFSPFDSYFHICQGLQQLQSSGYEVILAHVERYKAITDNPEYAEELYEMGIRLQINAGSICGKGGRAARKFVNWLLDRNLVFCVGTDAHNAKNRPPRMHKAANYVTQHYGEKITRRIFFSNAMQMLKKI